MPRLKLSVLVAVLWLVRGASPSHAIDVFWELENLSSFETGTTIIAENGDLIRASIQLDSSVDGVTGYSFSLLWDEALDLEPGGSTPCGSSSREPGIHLPHAPNRQPF